MQEAQNIRLHEHAGTGHNPYPMPGPVHKIRNQARVKLQEDVKDIIEDGIAETAKIIIPLTLINPAKTHLITINVIKPQQTPNDRLFYHHEQERRQY